MEIRGEGGPVAGRLRLIYQRCRPPLLLFGRLTHLLRGLLGSRGGLGISGRPPPIPTGLNLCAGNAPCAELAAKNGDEEFRLLREMILKKTWFLE